MSILNNKHKRKSAAITAIILLLLLFVVFNYGMKYLDPPEEYGLAINFGNSEVGIGETAKKTKKISTPKVVKKTEKVAKDVKEIPKEVVKEKMIIDDHSKDEAVIEKKKEVKKPVKKEIKKEISKEKLKPSKEITDALNSLLNGNSSEDNSKGEGNDKKEGVKGTKKGDLNSRKYYGNEGTSSRGNYNLAGRKALLKPIEQPDCQEEGIVVVRITVDKNGKVIRANPGVKGSTNTSPCLLNPAKEAALKTTWNADKKAPKIQIGTIIYKFSLTK